MAVATGSSQWLRLAGTVFGTISVGFGINAILRPAHGLTFFELEPPTAAADRRVVDALMAVYGIRDIFMGFAAYVAAYYGHSKILGWVMLATSAVAFGDGAICYQLGKGEWNHWGYAPIIALLGAILIR
jgi:hypothetical protein